MSAPTQTRAFAKTAPGRLAAAKKKGLKERWLLADITDINPDKADVAQSVGARPSKLEGPIPVIRSMSVSTYLCSV